MSGHSFQMRGHFITLYGCPSLLRNARTPYIEAMQYVSLEQKPKL